jgi:hypothetical protein
VFIGGASTILPGLKMPSAHPPVAVLAAERAAVFFDQMGHCLADFAQAPTVFFLFQV